MDEHQYKKKNSKQLARLILMVLLILALVWFVPRYMHTDEPAQDSAAQTEQTGGLTLLTDPPQTAAPETPAAQTAPTAAPEAPEEALPEESGSYLEVDDVAYYLHTYGHLPDNYMTKSEASDAGWVSYRGNLWEVSYGSSIGGDRCWNGDGQLPKGEKYYEADVNYDGGYRGSERIVYTDDGDIWYTDDHYESFEKLY